MAAAATDKFVEVGDPGSATTLDGNYTIGDSSITVVSTTNWPTATGVVFAIDEVTTVNGEQVRTAGTYNVYQGTVASSTSITNVSHISGTGTDRNYTAGTSTRVYIVVSSEIQNRLVNGILTHADQDGTLKAGAVDNAAVLASDVVTTAKILDANVTSDKVAAGMVVQVVSTNYSAVATGTTLLPFDDTIPQNTEGDQYMTLSITPKSTTNRLFIEAKLHLSSSVINNMTAALFQDSTASALAADEQTISGSGYAVTLMVTHDMVAGTTSATTFKIRAGGSIAGTTTFNGEAGARKLGGITFSTIKIMEYKA